MLSDENKDLLDEEVNEEENKETPEENEEVIEDSEAEKEVEAGIVAGLQDVSTVELVRSSFLDYAMSVIVARAIPDARDGLKPVHRRIIYGMNESGMQPDKPYKKSARIVGDVMGKYHPHGDTAIYQTLVRLAQPFSMRYTLVDGHGNFGDMDGDEAAAMRYTEARMTKLALEMVRDINSNTVDFVDNYDGTEREPAVLPSRFPNLLVNGSNGIAVGMATNIPPHNLNEVIDGVVAVAKNPEIEVDELMHYVKGPDFPTGALILGRSGIRDAYTNGTGSIAIRSRCHIEERGEHGALKQIVVTEVPYQTNKAAMVENIATLVRDKVIDGITDIRDESNKEGVRIVIEVRRDVIPEVLLNQLYKNTQLQTSYGIIMLCLVDGAPKVASLKTMLQSYLDYQVEIIARRTKFLLDKDEARIHIVLGLIKCHDNIDEIVDIIKASETPEDATRSLMERFGFTELQVQAILAMTLRRLTGIETEKLEAEKAQLELNIKEYKRILESRENEIEVVVKELLEIKEKFGDERRTEITNDAASIDDEDLIPQENIVVTLSRSGYVKRLTSDSFKAQNRGGRGVKGMSTNESDVVESMVYTKTHTDLLFFTDFGKVYRIRGYQIPEFNKSSKGVPVINLINIEKEERVKSIIAVDEYVDDKFLMFFTVNGLVKRTPIKEYELIRQNGKIAIELKEGDTLYSVKEVKADTLIGIATSGAKMVNFIAEEARPMGRTAAGVKGIELNADDRVVGVTTSLEGNRILSITEKGFGKITDATEYRITKRGAKGVSTLKVTDKVGNLVAVRAINEGEDLMCITNAGIVIRTPLDQVRNTSRNTQGVKIMSPEGRQKIVSITVVPHEDNSEEAPSEVEENIQPTNE